jgi:pimeloyl-ACP methyl ester carboxylesterase
MATVSLPGGPTLSYREWGRPDGAVVLMLHGLGSSGASWRHVAPALGERFRVIAPDARGHGDSEWTRDYSPELMADDVAGFLEQIGVLAAIMVGHSMGGVVAYAVAATRPELVRLLVLEEMPPPDPANPPRPYPRHSDSNSDHDWRAVVALRRWRNHPPNGWWEMADRIGSRTLVISAQHSDLPAARMEELAERIPRGSFVSVDAGHSVHEERPSEFLRPVEPFISWFAK